MARTAHIIVRNNSSESLGSDLAAAMKAGAWRGHDGRALSFPGVLEERSASGQFSRQKGPVPE